MAPSTVESTEDLSNVQCDCLRDDRAFSKELAYASSSFLAASESCMAASVLAEELLFIEHRLACELDGDKTRCGKASEPRRCEDWAAGLLKSQAGVR